MSKTQEDALKQQKAGLFYFFLALAVALASGAIVNKLIQSIVAAIAVGIGMFFFFFFVMNLHTVWIARRKGTHVWATVTGCELFAPTDQPAATPYYKVTYEIPNQRVATFVERFSEKPLENGAVVGGYYISKTNGFLGDEKIREINSNRSANRFMVGCFAVAIVAGVVSVLSRGKVSGEFWSIAFVWVLALAFLFFGVKVIGGARQRKRSFAEARRVPATLIRFTEKTEKDNDGDRHTYYMPVWSYEYGGEQREYQSLASKSKNQEIGTVTELCLDYAGNVYEEREEKAAVGGGIVLLVVGAGLLALAVVLSI